ncbi:MAG: hypothetical protein RIR51_1238 [Bacteroidota bacterium]|jgi:multidrug resistance efflux pump
MNKELSSYSKIYGKEIESIIPKWGYYIFGVILLFLFLPWTQNIRSSGKVTSLEQNNRAQEINSPIAGKIMEWKVIEGTYVKKGDTLAKIAEIKPEYLDPELMERTMDQIVAKESYVEFYKEKIKTIETQLEALKEGNKLKLKQLDNKLRQLENKLAGQRSELKSMSTNYELAKDQFKRYEQLFNEGLISKTDFQKREGYLQETLAKKTVVENYIEQTLQEITIVELEKNNVSQDFIGKFNKTQGEKFEANSIIQNSLSDIAKLKNQYQNYSRRNDFYTVLAPQDGQIVQVSKAGIGEIIKDGESLGRIVPSQENYAIEIYASPTDVALLKKEERVRIMFDGYPTVLFSGWPQVSVGTFSGKVYAVESVISPNNKFKILVKEDPSEKPWPPFLKQGTGVRAIVLLNDVPIWYEIWRNINGFPPNFYNPEEIKMNKEIGKEKK